MTGARSSNPPGLRLASCWDVGREGLFSQSLLSKAVYSALFSSSPAFWKSCVHWLVLLYFLSQLRDGLPGLKRPRRGRGGSRLPSASGLSEVLLLPGALHKPCLSSGPWLTPPGSCGVKGDSSLASRPVVGQKCFSPVPGGRFAGHCWLCLLGSPSPGGHLAAPALPQSLPRAPQPWDSDRAGVFLTHLSLGTPSLALAQVGFPAWLWACLGAGMGLSASSLLVLGSHLLPTLQLTKPILHISSHFLQPSRVFPKSSVGMMDKPNPSL